MAKTFKKQRINRNVLDLALERLNRAFDLFDTIDVSFSGGKDSTACLMLALEIARQRKRLPLRVFFHDEEAIPLQTVDYVRRVSQMPDVAFEWYCLPVKHRNACSRRSPWWSPWDPACPEKWVRVMPTEGIPYLEGFPMAGEPRDRMSIPEMNFLLHDPAKYGNVGMVMGIRGQESLMRTRAVSHRSHEHENYLIHFGANVWKVYPIYDWQTEDVWTAPKLFGWDYNEAYDVMDACGIPHLQQRCCPAYGEEPMQGFFRFKSCFPEIWDKMSQRVPGANTAFYYARTELYGFGGHIEKPEGMDWEDYVVHYISKFSGQDAGLVAHNVERLIKEHFNKTPDPILSAFPHPLTGMSWRAITNIAMRGDFKGRRARTMMKNGAEGRHRPYDQMYAEYQAVRASEGL